MKIFLRISILFTFFCLIVELSAYLILLGQPQNDIRKVIYTPNFCFTRSDLWFELVDGSYTVEIEDCLTSTIQHQNNKRFSGYALSDEKSIDIYGCSFTYGTGVSDKSTYPYLLQQNLKQYQINNYGVPGASSLLAYLKLNENLNDGLRPTIVIYAYAPFHEERNLLTRSYMSKLVSGFNSWDQKKQNQDVFYPKLVLNGSDEVDFEKVNVLSEYIQLPLQDKSSFVKLISNTVDSYTHKVTANQNASKKIIRAMKKLADEYKFELIIADVAKTNNSIDVQIFCDNNNINYVDISPDFSVAAYSLLPCDPHPSEFAHIFYSEILYEFLSKQIQEHN